MTVKQGPAWPSLQTYTGEDLRRIALPLGGIGTGTLSLGGRGDLRDWEIMNTPAKGYTPVSPDLKNLGSFFTISVLDRKQRITRCLEGPIDSSEYEAPEGCKTPNSGFPRFRKATFHAAYPCATIELEDPDIPLQVQLRAMNPMIPGDSASSSLPCAMLTFHVHNPTHTTVEATICGTFLNPIGCDGRQRKTAQGSRIRYVGWSNNQNQVTPCHTGNRLHLTSDAPETDDEAYGDICITANGGADAGTRTAWAEKSWGDTILDFWDEFSNNGRITPRESDSTPYKLLCSTARSITLQPGESNEIRFGITWRFPNRKAWAEDVIGNHYAQRFASAIEAADYVLANWDELTNRTLAFVRAVCDSPFPLPVKEAALFNASTLRTQTCFQTPDGHFFGWEGIHDEVGSCQGSCTHVWNYEQTTPFLFANLARSMREVEFLHATNEEGAMRFRTKLPLALNDADNKFEAAADGQMGCIMKIYRDWKLCGDDIFLAKIWPKVKKALSFAWVKGGWDANQDGVMEGCQHNTMDVDYYGPNPQMQGWYLGALKAAASMATYLTQNELVDESTFAEKCLTLFEQGRDWTDQHLFNGEYYEHLIALPDAIHPNTTNNAALDQNGDPILQLGKGCLIDQLVGQYMAHICGLGYILNPEHIRTTLRSILKYNLKHGFHDHFNHLRNYVFADEVAVLMATYPHGDRPQRPFPYYNEVMTGFEHTLAAHLIYEGMIEEGISLVSHIRNRYDGKKRNPYNEAECGHHYARAMAAWTHILALSAFQYDGTTETLYLSLQSQPTFFSFGQGWGTWHTVTDETGSTIATITLEEGTLPIQRICIRDKEIPFRIHQKPASSPHAK